MKQELIFGCDKNGIVGAVMTIKQAENAVAKDRAKWVGINVIQFMKIFREPSQDIYENIGAPMPGTARPEICWSDGNNRESRDISVMLSGKNAKETLAELRSKARIDTEETLAIWREWGAKYCYKHSDYLKPIKLSRSNVTFNEVVSSLKLQPIIRGGGEGTRRPGHSTHIPQERIYFPEPTLSDIGKGWINRSIRSYARRKCWKKLQIIYESMTGKKLQQGREILVLEKNLREIWKEGCFQMKFSAIDEMYAAIRDSQHPSMTDRGLQRRKSQYPNRKNSCFLSGTIRKGA